MGMYRAEDAFSALLDATTPQDVWARHSSALAGFGFTNLIYAYAHHIDSEGLDFTDFSVIYSTLPQHVISRFLGEGLHRHHPYLEWLRDGPGLSSWQDAQRRFSNDEMSSDEHECWLKAQDVGLISGYVQSLTDPDAQIRAVIAMCPAKGRDQEVADRLWGCHGETIMRLNQLMHLRLSNAAPVGQTTAPELTERQRDVLELTASGLTVGEIAQRMGRSTATVEKHLRLARERLGCTNTAQAVLKAAIQRRIFTGPNAATLRRTAQENRRRSLSWDDLGATSALDRQLQ